MLKGLFELEYFLKKSTVLEYYFYILIELYFKLVESDDYFLVC